MKNARVLPKGKVSRTVTPPSDLPGRPMVKDMCGHQGAVDPKWIIRDTSGEVVYLKTWVCGQYVAAMARGYLGREIRRVVFVRGEKDFAKQCALAVVHATGESFRKLTGQDLYALLAIKRVYDVDRRRGGSQPSQAWRAFHPGHGGKDHRQSRHHY